MLRLAHIVAAVSPEDRWYDIAEVYGKVMRYIPVHVARRYYDSRNYRERKGQAPRTEHDKIVIGSRAYFRDYFRVLSRRDTGSPPLLIEREGRSITRIRLSPAKRRLLNNPLTHPKIREELDVKKWRSAPCITRRVSARVDWDRLCELAQLRQGMSAVRAEEILRAAARGVRARRRLIRDIVTAALRDNVCSGFVERQGQGKQARFRLVPPRLNREGVPGAIP